MKKNEEAKRERHSAVEKSLSPLVPSNSEFIAATYREQRAAACGKKLCIFSNSRDFFFFAFSATRAFVVVVDEAAAAIEECGTQTRPLLRHIYSIYMAGERCEGDAALSRFLFFPSSSCIFQSSRIYRRRQRKRHSSSSKKIRIIVMEEMNTTGRTVKHWWFFIHLTVAGSFLSLCVVDINPPRCTLADAAHTPTTTSMMKTFSRFFLCSPSSSFISSIGCVTQHEHISASRWVCFFCIRYSSSESAVVWSEILGEGQRHLVEGCCLWGSKFFFIP